ncbi:MAG: hypothetical protein H0U23_14210 [Blastocatellia bacterium]|nr:hypothetical protein [Blastocatellia bacterium]
MLTPLHGTYSSGARGTYFTGTAAITSNFKFEHRIPETPKLPSLFLLCTPPITFSNPMPPKADPYATPVHRRIDIILFAVTFAIVAILLSTSADAGTGVDFTGGSSGNGTALTSATNYSSGTLPNNTLMFVTRP